jgi:hypothetical protein
LPSLGSGQIGGRLSKGWWWGYARRAPSYSRFDVDLVADILSDFIGGVSWVMQTAPESAIRFEAGGSSIGDSSSGSSAGGSSDGGGF